MSVNCNIDRLASLCLFLALCLVVPVICLAAADPHPAAMQSDAQQPEAGASSAGEILLSIDDSDDDEMLTLFVAQAVLSVLIASASLPYLARLSERWPPPLRPPQVYSDN